MLKELQVPKEFRPWLQNKCPQKIQFFTLAKKLFVKLVMYNDVAQNNKIFISTVKRSIDRTIPIRHFVAYQSTVSPS